MSWPAAIKTRAPVWKAVLWRPVVVLVTIAWTLISNFTTLRDILPQRLRDALQPLSFSLPLWGWGLGVLGILLIAVIEGAYREISQRDAVIEQGKPKPRTFGDLVQLHATEQSHDINLSIVNTDDTDWFTVSVLDVRRRVSGDKAPLPWDVKWADVADKRRHIPKNSPASLRLCRIESKEADKTRRATLARFFTPTEELEITLSLAEAWNAQDIFIGFYMVVPEIDLRITAEGANKTTDRRVALTLDDSLNPRVYRVEVIPQSS
jgi:hypothetical protein